MFRMRIRPLLLWLWLAVLVGSCPSTVLSQNGAGTALQFDGVNDEGLTSSPSDWWHLPITVTAWVKTTQNVSAFVGIAGDYSVFKGYSIAMLNGRVHAWYYRTEFDYVWIGQG